MRVSSRFGRRALALVGLVFACSVGCNAILDNQPGVLGEQEGGASVGPSAHDRGSSSQPGASAEPVAGPGIGSDSDPDAGVCGPETKSCAGFCIPLEDPSFGCAAARCSPCALANATPACRRGACAVGQCTAGFADCNADPWDGCEIDLTQDLANCGACAHVCRGREHTIMTCTGGLCAGLCEPGFADCNAKPDDGCERNLLKDKRNCGACGRRCVFGHCEDGSCSF